jgi:hypothetical protein
VILSLAKRLENLLFTTPHTFFGVWPRDHYMLLQRFTMGHMPDFARVVRGTLTMLRFPEIVHNTTTPLASCRLGQITMMILTHPSKSHFPQYP